MNPTDPDPSTQIAVRLPQSLLDRVRAHADRLQSRNPGMKLSRADAFRVLLIERLDQIAAEERSAT